jgi:hypothetical protein
MNNKLTTKGGIVVSEIKVGDIHYEFEYGCGIKSKVLTLPVRDENGGWSWKSERIHPNPSARIDSQGKVIEYYITEDYPHYGPNLYDYEAYSGIKYI